MFEVMAVGSLGILPGGREIFPQPGPGGADVLVTVR